MKNLFILFSVVIASFFVCGCNKIKDGINPPENAVYLDMGKTVFAYRSINFPSGDKPLMDTIFFVAPKLVQQADGPVKINLAIDNSLVVKYNQVNGTSYDYVPSAYYALTDSLVNIETNKVAGDVAKLRFKFYGDEIPPGKEYLLPVTITDVSSGMNIVASSRTAYFLIKRTQ